MIERVTLKDCATYRHRAVAMEKPRQVNFLYGANGSGKTTISRTIAGRQEFIGSSSVEWGGDKKLETYVYNRDFLDENFESRESLPGVFTLGTENIETVNAIALRKAEITKLERKVANLEENLDSVGDDITPQGLKQKQEQLNSNFLNEVWDAQNLCDDSLKSAFKGLRNSRVKFRDRLLQEAASNTANLLSAKELIARATTVFSERPAEQEKLEVPSYLTLSALEADPLLGKVIVGKADVAIAEMIEKLGNSDWVRKGRGYLEKNGDVCPFCQRPTDPNFRESLEAYFDEVHEKDGRDVTNIHSKYASSADNLLSALAKLVDSSCEFLDIPALQVQVAALETILRGNIQLLTEKCAALSRSVSLKPIEEGLEAICGTLAAANVKIEKRNELCQNLDAERRRLSAEVWQLLVGDVLKKKIEEYQNEHHSIQDRSAKIRELIGNTWTDISAKQAEIDSLESTRTNVLPTIKKINDILEVYGFQGFKLAPAEESKSYKIVRATGEDAKNSLSEGEKTLVGFLYFYFLVEGSLRSTGVMSDRVVVFDDPVSSLDSDTLFVVSSLVREVVMSVARENTPVKQLFVLTHNIYFHKEVCYDAWKGWIRDNGDELPAPQIAYWVVTKRNEESEIEQFERNPIKSNYELLWCEIVEDKSSLITVQNCMRRILEHYFRFVGKGFKQGLLERFSGDEGHVCRSLLSWVNDGSHSVLDDLHAPMSSHSVELYRSVFERVFLEMGHQAHHEMMSLVAGR